MPLEWLQVEDFRCLERVKLEPAAGRNLITGENASGKTSLLEAIFYLGRGRSFRAATGDPVIRDGQSAFTVVGRVRHDSGGSTLGLKVERGKVEARINGAAAAGLASLAEALPVQIVDPEVHKLIEEGPGRRRRFLDWGVFHVEHRFIDAWRRYQRALKQRNAALKLASSEAEVWDQELVAAGEDVGQYRQTYVNNLSKHLDIVAQALLGCSVSLSYYPGWSGQRGFAEALATAIERDRDYRVTHVGPHRADLRIEFSGRPARGRVSRGQQKLLAAAMILAQNDYLRAEAGDPGVLLFDDPAAELDPQSLGRFMEQIESRPAQMFITSLNPAVIPFSETPAVFHVKHGAVTPE